jgi:hypothetical protein
MKTTPDSQRSPYLAYEVKEGSRQRLLRMFPPKYPETICGHVTIKFPASEGDVPPAPVESAYVVGYADSGDGLEALVVEIDGGTKRADGKFFHITLSLDRAAGKKPVQSNALVSKGYQPVGRIPIWVEPKVLR